MACTLRTEKEAYDVRVEALSDAILAANLTFGRSYGTPVAEVADLMTQSFAVMLYLLWERSVERFKEAANYYEIEGQEAHLDLPYFEDPGINRLRLTHELLVHDRCDLFQADPNMFSDTLHLMVEERRSPHSYKPYLELKGRHLDQFIEAMRRSGPQLKPVFGASAYDE